MTLQQARKFRDFLKSEGIRCVVPRKRSESGGYFVRVRFTHERDAIDFEHGEEWNVYARKQQAILDKFIADNRHLIDKPRDTRSPIERMVDEACGL